MATGEASSEELPKDHVKRLISEGLLSQDTVDDAIQYWQRNLTREILISSGDRITISLRDFYHLITVSRIFRKPYRIERILAGATEVRTSYRGRRKVASEWVEDGRPLVGYFVLDDDNHLRAVHIVDKKRITRLMSDGELPWRK